MKRRSTLFCLLGLALFLPAADLFGQQPSSVSGKSQDKKIRVGTYDSRLVAVAYVRSDLFKKRLAEFREQVETAKKNKDEKRVKEIETTVVELQHHVHKQGFSTWPVNDIISRIEDQLPGIAKKAKVDLIVSRWDITYQRTGIQTVDVTDLLVETFQPDNETKKVLESLRKKPPVPLKQIKKHH